MRLNARLQADTREGFVQLLRELADNLDVSHAWFTLNGAGEASFEFTDQPGVWPDQLVESVEPPE